jgi:hypothetical protein
MPTSNPSGNGDTGNAGIELTVGEELKLTRENGWATHPLSHPLSSVPSVLKFVSGSSHDVIATYLAVGPGLAYVGAESDVCGTGIQNTCEFALVHVTP